MSDNKKITKVVEGIIADVIKRGDAALVEYTAKFDGFKSSAAKLKVSAAEINSAYKKCSKDLIKALEFAASRIESYHKKQMPSDLLYTDEAGVKLGWKWTPVASAGLYVPGGTASYPSSVLMNAIPAKVAGVERLAMVVPAPGGKIKDVVLAAAKIAGVDEMYKIGGAQAIAALAYGTKTIPAVDKIVGPGNAYVAEAKRQVFGRVGIDMIAGPSEILIIADADNNPDWIAADLMSQAEHDADARSILVTTDKKLAAEVKKSVAKIIRELSRRAIAEKSWNNNGKIITVKNLDEAAEIANEIAAEHLEIAVKNPEKLAARIKNAGAIFLGNYTPEAIGDYMAGPSHVLPTSGSARFSSGLGVYDFLKRTSIIGCDKKSFDDLADATELLAEEEGLLAHALSVKIRK